MFQPCGTKPARGHVSGFDRHDIIAPMGMNPARRTMWVCIGIALAAIFGIFAPSIFGMDGFNGGFAISFACIILAVTMVILTIMYSGRAKSLDTMLDKKNVLAHWSYTPEEWQAYTQKAYSADTRDKWGLYKLVMAITFIVCAGFFPFHHDSGIIMVGLFLGLGILLAAVILITTNYDHFQNEKHRGEVFVTENGVFVNRQLHLWKGWGARLEDVQYNEKDNIIEITYSTPSTTMRETYTVRVPVPDGQEAKAREVIAQLNQAGGLNAEPEGVN